MPALGGAATFSLMPRSVDLTGQRYGQLQVVALHPERIRGGLAWLCRCDCGVEKVISSNNLRRGHTVSCGCTRPHLAHGHALRNGRPTPEYMAWTAMKQRCQNPRHRDYASYGGRGITVCPEWRASFESFFTCIGPRPGRGYSLDRIDNDGNYEPGNVRWATLSEQNRNQRRRTPGLKRKRRQMVP